MSDVVIRAEGLGKKFLIGHENERERYTAFRDVLARAARSLARSIVDMARGRQLVPGDELEEFWALKDVSFDIKRGDVVGIIGRNGAGKSTLLKVLSRITEPSKGRVTIKGRVASLLEVGTGFHPELSGRENIYLNGAILGMSRAEINRKFEEIIAFAEVEKFLDTPVKRYSSGMYVRLAFAVAAHLEPEILIIDEVLAVGDAAFQKKCLGKMRDVAGTGRTVLFVSHNMAAIATLCTQAFIYDSGALIFSGDVGAGISLYSRNCEVQSVYKKKYVDNLAPQIVLAKNKLFARPECGERRLQLNVTVICAQKMPVEFAVRIKDNLGIPIGFAQLGSLMADTPVLLEAGETDLVLSIDVSHLALGTYTLSLELTRPFVQFYDKCEDCLLFEIGGEHFSGILQPFRQDWGAGSVLFEMKDLGRSISKTHFIE